MDFWENFIYFEKKEEKSTKWFSKGPFNRCLFLKRSNLQQNQIYNSHPSLGSNNNKLIFWWFFSIENLTSNNMPTRIRLKMFYLKPNWIKSLPRATKNFTLNTICMKNRLSWWWARLILITNCMFFITINLKNFTFPLLKSS